MTAILDDLIAAARGLARRPGYALTVVATLALAIGALTAVYALLDRVLLRPLPFPAAERVVIVRNRNAGNEWNTSVVDHQAIAAQTTTFDAVASMRGGEAILTGGPAGGGEPRWVATRAVTAGFFELLGVVPERGRGFLPGEDAPGAARGIVLSHGLAAERFGDDDPLGRVLELDGVPHTVVGVMPAGFERLNVVRAEAWPVLQLAEPTRRGPFFLATLGRLAPGATLEQGGADLAAISRRIFPLWQAGFRDETARLMPRPLRDQVVRGTGTPLWAAFGAVLAVLAIAVVNVANLAAMRVAERHRDLAVRAALGASRARLARLLLGEGLLLAAASAVLGAALGVALLELYRALGPPLPRLAEVVFDLRVLGVAALAGIASGLALGLLPLLFGLPTQDAAPAAGGARVMGATHGRRWLRDGLVALEFALALPLLVASLLLMASLVRLQEVEVGAAAPERVLTAKLRLLDSRYADDGARRALWARAREALAALPGVEAVGFAGAVPPSCGCQNNFEVVGRPSAEGQEPTSAWVAIGEGYLDALGLRLVEGRGFGPGDTPDSMRALVVSASWAARHLPAGRAIGSQVYEGGDRERPLTVIGVVEDVRYDGLDQDGATAYGAISQGWSDNPTYLHLRAHGDPRALIEPMRATLAALDPTLVPTEVATLDALLDGSLGGARHWAAVLAAAAAVAVLLAALGAFAVLGYQVATRRREIGVRLALGADARAVAFEVVGRGLRWAAIGVGVGMALALAATRGLESLLFGVERGDPALLALAAMALLVVAAAASFLPARRAAAVDPAIALRED